MKICVLGAGAMGCLYGGCLSYIGHDVTLVGGRSIPVIRGKGLKMHNRGDRHNRGETQPRGQGDTTEGTGTDTTEGTQPRGQVP